jgi:vacuolar-type H+-ATPase subunit E/Vma4
MTSIEVLIEALLSDAYEKGKKIIQDAKNKVDNTIEEQRKKGRDDARERVISIKRKAKEESELINLSNLASAEINAQWLILEKKHAMIDNVLNQVKEELRILVKAENYIKILENLIIEGCLILNTPELELMLNSKDSTLFLDLGTLVKRIGEKTSNNIKLTKSPISIETIGGVKIQSNDGKMILDNTFEGILEHNNDKIRFKIAQILFE